VAKQPQQQQQQPVPYPKNWGKLNAQQKHEWMQANRPGYKDAAPAQPAKAPTAQQQQQQPGGQHQSPTTGQQLQEQPGDVVPVKLKVALWAVKVGDREPVECSPADLGDLIASEQRAYDEDHKQPETGGEGDSQDEDEF
jgi:hypothetical protein